MCCGNYWGCSMTWKVVFYHLSVGDDGSPTKVLFSWYVHRFKVMVRFCRCFICRL
ncbi:hypothetical protein BT93_K0825 [Corymbia citriodora subsp. variegata]|nr:hypothetical protein BT93_K0825 [Corymbia citriodora subsp. variegata]